MFALCLSVSPVDKLSSGFCVRAFRYSFDDYNIVLPYQDIDQV
jgi:hypothetical protein